MKKLILKITAAIFIVFILVAILVPVFVDVNYYKDEISSLVKDYTGLTLDIQGDISLSVLTGIKFSVTDVKLSNAEKVIADIESFTLKVSPASFYSSEIIITSVDVNARSLNILIDKKGRYNFISSTDLQNKNSENNDFETEEKLSIKKIAIKNIQLHIDKLNYKNSKNGDFIALKQAEAKLSLLPVIDHYQLVIDKPSVLVDYEFDGGLVIKHALLKQYQLKDLVLDFTDDNGVFSTDTFHFSFMQQHPEEKKNKTQSGSRLMFKFAANGELKLELAYPKADKGTLLWSKPESLRIEMPVLDLSKLQVQDRAYTFNADQIHLTLSPQNLYEKGLSKLDELTIQSIHLKGDKIKMLTPEQRQYSFSSIDTILKQFPVFKNGSYVKPFSKNFLTRFAQQGEFSLKTGQLFGDDFGMEKFEVLIQGKQQQIVLSKLSLHAMNSVLLSKGKIFWDKNKTRWQLNIKSQKLNVKPISELFQTGHILEGYVAINNDLSGILVKNDFQILEGKALLTGNNLQLSGFDLNKVLEDFQNSQSVGLVDVGAVVLLGPAGVLVSKGNDYRNLIDSISNKGSSKITAIHSDISFTKGIATMQDVAFSTDKYRLAITGKIDTINDKFVNFSVATVDKKGCPVYVEQVMGSLSSPKVKKVNVLVSSVVNPIQSVISKVAKAVNMDCEKSFYKGAVAPPAR